MKSLIINNTIAIVSAHNNTIFSNSSAPSGEEWSPYHPADLEARPMTAVKFWVCWASHVCYLASPTPSHSIDDFHSIITTLSIPHGEDIIESTDEVSRAIDSLALDQTSDHLQFGRPSLIVHLTTICNAILAIAHLPLWMPRKHLAQCHTRA